MIMMYFFQWSTAKKKKKKKKVEILDRLLLYITEKGIYPVSNKYINEGCKVEGALTMQESMMKIFGM